MPACRHDPRAKPARQSAQDMSKLISCASYVARDRINPPLCQDILERYQLMLLDQLLRRIECPHTTGHHHCDIKPGNFLLGLGKRGNVVYMTDLGVAAYRPAWYDSFQNRDPSQAPRLSLIGTLFRDRVLQQTKSPSPDRQPTEQTYLVLVDWSHDTAVASALGFLSLSLARIQESLEAYPPCKILFVEWNIVKLLAPELKGQLTCSKNMSEPFRQSTMEQLLSEAG